MTGDVAREAPAWPQAMATGPFIDIPYSLLHPDRGKRGAMFKRRSEVEKFLAVDDLLDRLHAHTGRRVRDVVWAGMAGLALMASGPYLAWLPLELLARPSTRAPAAGVWAAAVSDRPGAAPLGGEPGAGTDTPCASSFGRPPTGAAAEPDHRGRG